MTHPSPIIAAHALAVYNAMETRSEDGIFRGSLVKVYDTCGVSRSHYKRIFELLNDLSCITVDQRGHGSSPSVVYLHRPPTEQEISDWYLTKGPRSDKTLLETRVARIEQGYIGGLDIKKALQDLASAIEGKQDKV